MKVVYKETILEQIMQEVEKAEEQGKVIDYLTITDTEADVIYEKFIDSLNKNKYKGHTNTHSKEDFKKHMKEKTNCYMLLGIPLRMEISGD
jgi:hypothetical protein